MAVAPLPISDILPEGYPKAKACIKVTQVQREINAGVNKIIYMQNLTLKVVDAYAPSEKYPQWGHSIDFVDAEGKKYYVEYPKYKSCIHIFLLGMTYNLDASVKETKVLGSTYTKLTRIKNVKFIN